MGSTATASGAPGGRRRRSRAAGPLGAVLAVAALAVLGFLAGPSGATAPAPSSAPEPFAPAALHPANATPVAASIVQLGDQANPPAICDDGQSRCPAITGTSQVTLQAQAGIKGENAWPAVQVLFLLEITPYDGVYDPSAAVPGADPCADQQIGTSGLCDESNLVPFFAANAGSIAETLQGEYPNTTMSFGLVDYFATHDTWDAGGGSSYRADVARFQNASQFAGVVDEGFVKTVLGGSSIVLGSDLAQNFLTSDSVSALYRAILGDGNLTWSDTAHHVIVELGSTAPREPAYPENYCVSPAVTPGGLSNCVAPTCEPSITYQGSVSPNCDGWVLSNDGNPNDTIAAFAHVAPSCADSLGGNCTIDVIDVNDTPTNPWSPSWSAAGGAGGPANWTEDASNILEAGCDMASATGGSWEGPTWFGCTALGVHGNLPGVPFGDPDNPHTSNPTLAADLARIGLGEVPTPVVAKGAGQPMFEFIPWGNFGPALVPSWSVSCVNATGVKEGCPSQPQVFYSSNAVVYGWNWSDTPSLNEMHLGDRWTATFFVSSQGPPFGLLPVDACTTRACLDAGSNQIGPLYTSMTFLEYGSQTIVSESFGLIQVTLEPLNPLGVPVLPTPPGLPPPAPTTPPPSGPPVLPPTPAPPIPAAVISVEAAAAGFIAAGWTAIGVRYPPQATKQASLSGATGKNKKRRRQGPTSVPLHWA